jgi:hypothetical protein
MVYLPMDKVQNNSMYIFIYDLAIEQISHAIASEIPVMR